MSDFDYSQMSALGDDPSMGQSIPTPQDYAAQVSIGPPSPTPSAPAVQMPSYNPGMPFTADAAYSPGMPFTVDDVPRPPSKPAAPVDPRFGSMGFMRPAGLTAVPGYSPGAPISVDSHPPSAEAAPATPTSPSTAAGPASASTAPSPMVFPSSKKAGAPDAASSKQPTLAPWGAVPAIAHGGTGKPQSLQSAMSAAVHPYGTSELGLAEEAREKALKAGVQDDVAGNEEIRGIQSGAAADTAIAAEEARKRADQRLFEDTTHTEEMQKMADANAAFRVDPTRWVANQSVFQKIMLGIAATAKGLSMGLLKEGGENPVLRNIQDNIDKDIKLQQADYERGVKKGEDIQNLYALNRKATDSHEDAIERTRAMMKEKVADDLAAASSGVKSASLQNGLAVNIADLRVQAAQARQQQAAAATAQAQAAAAAQAKADKERAQKLVDEYAGLSLAQGHQAAVYERTGINPDPNTPLPSFLAPEGYNQKGERVKTPTAASDQKAAAVGEALNALNASSDQATGTDLSRLSSHSAASAQERVRAALATVALGGGSVSSRQIATVRDMLEPKVGDTDEARKILLSGMQQVGGIIAKAPVQGAAPADEGGGT